MRNFSTFAIKNSDDARQSKSALPKDGTKLRNVYDLFYNNKGYRIDIEKFKFIFDYDDCNKIQSRIKSAIRDLIDYYGCDIRDRILVGEWCGKVYIDYTKEAVDNSNDIS